ncbi:hypothetical protein [Streptomyces sp. MK37H]|uniref:hypothetical protein n=1 Tax=Streptomyces sp. MK37H TaxID=2699117 RepID=UPI001B35909A|nr:hypothetical protein [Streptomyces sp. MK37H]MBP8535534.1 hypothetical protein [Streptomyces sp. MK37H]
MITYAVHVIGSRIRPASAECPGRAALLLGLVVLIAVHLAGVAHGAAFEGPHVGLATVGSCVHPGEKSDIAEPTAPAPGHQHEAHGHIDHAVDRPRDSAHDHGPAPAHEGPSPTSSPAAWPFPDAARHPANVSRAPGGGRSTLALHCVWRQ